MGQFRDPILFRASGSRRGLFGGGALALAAAAVPGLLTPEAAAKMGKGKKGKNGNGNNRGGAGDTRILNYALTLEHLEYAFYRDGLEALGDGAFDPDVLDNLKLIRKHEQEHVDALIATIEQRGGNPVEEGCYEFSAAFASAAAFLETAQLLENTGVMAYTGALAQIKNPALQTTGATIATVEARHASYLNFINGDTPFPDSFDEPKSEAEILKAAAGFFSNGECDNEA